MFFLAFDLKAILPAALCGMLLTLLVLGLLLLVLRLFGFRLFFYKRPSATKKSKMQESEIGTGEKEPGDISEEELLVILTAAAMEALDPKDAKRFRVVAFRRI